MKVLLVEDSIYDLDGIRNFVPWEKLDCEIVAMETDGKAGLESAKKFMPDLVLADISMPLMDGITMCKEIKKINPKVCIIFLTCFEKFEYAQEAISLGACEYITKPINVDKLIECIMKIKNMYDKDTQNDIALFKLEEQARKNRPYFVRSFLKDVITGMGMREGTIDRYATELDIDTECKYSMILFDMHFAERDVMLSVQLLTDLVNEKLIGKYGGWIIEIKTGLFVTIYPSVLDKDELIDKLNSIQQNFIQLNSVELTICIGKTEMKFYELADEYRHMTDVLDNCLFYTPNNIVYADELGRKNNTVAQLNISEIKKDILTVLSMEDDIVQAFIDKYLRVGDVTQIREIAGYIILILNVVLNEMRIESFGNHTDSYLKNVRNLNNFNEMKAYIYEMFVYAKTEVAKIYSYSPKETVRKIIDVINDEYAKIETVEDITDRFGYNSTYMNKTFKKYSGNTIYEYLINVRILKAKEFLKNPNMRSADVAEAVGFRTARYFTTVFKKQTGLSPGQYRTYIKENGSDDN